MPDLEWNRATWGDPGQWPDGGDCWSVGWGGPRAQWYGTIYPRIARWLPADRMLEIAPGYGRWSQFLLGHAGEYYGVDYSPLCVNACRQRFAAFNRAHFIVNDGRSLADVPDNSIDFVFSFDSLVHVEDDVIRAYCEQVVRKLSPAGVAFLHYSNALAGIQSGEAPYPDRSRAASVSSSAVKRIIERAAGRVLVQEEINWYDSKTRIDCMTTFCRDTAHAQMGYRLIENNDFINEMERVRASIACY